MQLSVRRSYSCQSGTIRFTHVAAKCCSSRFISSTGLYASVCRVTTYESSLIWLDVVRVAYKNSIEFTYPYTRKAHDAEEGVLNHDPLVVPNAHDAGLTCLHALPAASTLVLIDLDAFPIILLTIHYTKTHTTAIPTCPQSCSLDSRRRKPYAPLACAARAAARRCAKLLSFMAVLTSCFISRCAR